MGAASAIIGTMSAGASDIPDLSEAHKPANAGHLSEEERALGDGVQSRSSHYARNPAR